MRGEECPRSVGGGSVGGVPGNRRRRMQQIRSRCGDCGETEIRSGGRGSDRTTSPRQACRPPARRTVVQTGKADAAPGSVRAARRSSKQPPSIPGEQLDTITVPSGTPEELMAFINQLGERVVGVQRQIQSGNANPAAMQPMFEAMLEASDKLLAADIDLETRKRAISYKAGALTMLSRLAPDRPWAEQIREFAKSLAADKDASVSIEGRSILLGLLVGEISQKRSQDVDGLMAQLKSVLADEARNDSVLEYARNRRSWLCACGPRHGSLRGIQVDCRRVQGPPQSRTRRRGGQHAGTARLAGPETGHQVE